MPKTATPISEKNMNKLGFHYFPDTKHYRQHDLDIWLPRLKSLGVRWLVVNAPVNRAIPEPFLTALIQADIQPVLHFHLEPNKFQATKDLQLLFRAYQSWGLRYAALYDQPNAHQLWRASAWTQADLVERFLDLYLPTANICLNAGLTPIFPPLKPGGDYWDTAFLRSALQSMLRRGQQELLDQLVIGAYACPGDHPIQWGAGGPERWPNARPYYTPPGVEDHRGFRIFDWYSAISRAVLSTPRPIFLFGMGYSSEVAYHVNRNLTITRLLEGEFLEGYDAVPREVIGGAFALLVDPYGDSGPVQGWFRQNGEPRTQAESLRKWARKDLEFNKPSQSQEQSIRHYLLLPSYNGSITDYHLDIIRPIIKKYQPTVGFSLEEARHAQKVTVIGGEHAFPEASLNQLRGEGIQVRRIQEDGTDIASILATL